MNQPSKPVLESASNLWRRDESLRRAGELIEKIPGLRAVTFDFFDTLVWRLAAKPTDVFVEAGQRLRQAGLLPVHISNQDYEVLRRQAEMKARTSQALAWVMASSINTPGMTGKLGKWSAKYSSAIVKDFTAVIRAPG